MVYHRSQELAPEARSEESPMTGQCRECHQGWRSYGVRQNVQDEYGVPCDCPAGRALKARFTRRAR